MGRFYEVSLARISYSRCSRSGKGSTRLTAPQNQNSVPALCPLLPAMPSPFEMPVMPEGISAAPQESPASDTLFVSAPSSLSHEESSSTSSSQTKSGNVAPVLRTEVLNLASLAARVARRHKSTHEVRYYSQVDMQSVVLRHGKWGQKRTEMLAVLDGTDLSISRTSSRSADESTQMRKHANDNSVHRNKPNKTLVVNVRNENVRVDKDNMDLVVYKDGQERLVRFQISDEDLTCSWDAAITAAKACDINQFYELGELIGRGACSQVFEAVDVCTQEKRATKIVHRSSNLKSVEQLTREIEIMKAVSHPGIVRIHQIFDLKRKVYIVMECVPGGDLFDFVAKQEALAEFQVSNIMRQILEAVAYLHDKNIVHRDLKAENILCVKDEWPLDIKIIDFGSSSISPEGSREDIMYTPVAAAYITAPEIVAQKGHGTPVDLWACGVIMYTILTGSLPFPGRNRDEYFRNVATGEPVFSQRLWNGISNGAKNLVKGLLNKDPKKRLNAIGAMNHKWITSADELPSGSSKIKRNRANLNSSRRRLFKARSAIIAVAMAQKLRAASRVELVEEFPVAVDQAGAGAKSQKVGEGAKKTRKPLAKLRDRRRGYQSCSTSSYGSSDEEFVDANDFSGSEETVDEVVEILGSVLDQNRANLRSGRRHMLYPRHDAQGKNFP